jgi:hypothetical protein
LCYSLPILCYTVKVKEDAVVEMNESSGSASAVEPRGFGGWLGLWIFGTFIVQPLAILVAAFEPVASTADASVLGLTYGAILAFLLWLWTVVAKKDARSLRWIRIYLRLVLAIGFASFSAGAMMYGITGGTENVASGDFVQSVYLSSVNQYAAKLFKDGFLWMLSGSIWYAYFRKSRRVRNTFGDNIGRLWG